MIRENSENSVSPLPYIGMSRYGQNRAAGVRKKFQYSMMCLVASAEGGGAKFGAGWQNDGRGRLKNMTQAGCRWAAGVSYKNTRLRAGSRRTAWFDIKQSGGRGRV